MKKNKTVLSYLAIISLSLALPYTALTIENESATETVAMDTTKNAITPKGKAETPIADFESQISQGYVILDFYAEWCPPCRKLKPLFTKVATEYPEIKFIKVNIDRHSGIANQFHIRSYPTLVVLKDGQEIKRHMGFMNIAKLRTWVNTNTK